MTAGYEHILAFTDHLEKNGLIVKGEIIADGEWHHCHVRDDKPNEKNGSYLLHLDGVPNGIGWIWKGGGQKFPWKAPSGSRRMSSAEREAMDARTAADKARRADEQAAIYAHSAARANGVWDASGEAPASHAYLKKKLIEAHGARIGDWVVESPPDPETGEVRETIIKGALIVPIKNGKKEIVSLQAIFPDYRNPLGRGKDFLRGGQKTGCFFPIGSRPKDPGEELIITFCEGFATGASIHEATGRLVIVCFDCGNLDPVVNFFRERFPDTEFVIAADNDRWTPKNPGATKAFLAARKYDCMLAAPEFAKLDGKPTDFNDLRVLEGIHVVREQIESVIAGRRTVNAGYALLQHAARGEVKPQTYPPADPVTVQANRNDVPDIVWQELPPAKVDGSNAMVIGAADLRMGVGSDIEIADLLARSLQAKLGRVVYTDGQFWRHASTHWKALDGNALRLLVHQFDRIIPMESKAPIKLTSHRIDSILRETATMLAESGFFDIAAPGINCASGFIEFGTDGVPNLVEHRPEHRQRHVLPAQWMPSAPEVPPADSLLAKLLGGIFKGDPDAEQKLMTLAEVAGSAAVGYATKLMQPKAVILKGASADNGKSQVLDLFRSLLPEAAISAISPTDMSMEDTRAGLLGKLLNARDELSGARSIAGSLFKGIVTGEPVTARQVYKPTVTFRPVAQHVFTTNALPPFNEGIDRGVRRRLLVILFNRSIPDDEKIENIGLRIGTEEPDYILAWAVGGASRLIRQRNFTIPASSQDELREWCLSANPVEAWRDACVRPAEGQSIRTGRAHASFLEWGRLEGYDDRDLPKINGFVQRAKALGILHVRVAEGGCFRNIATIPAEHPFEEAA